jgi:pimeloyl-ACP methyl ester carboxylesterase
LSDLLSQSLFSFLFSRFFIQMTQTWQIGGLNFTVDVAGPAAGAPVILLHGFPQNRRMWRHQLNALAAAGFRALAPDQRGYCAGARPQGVDAYATGLLIGDVLAMIDATGAQRFHLVGHDWGGQLAWLIAAAHPHRVQTLSVLSRPHPAAFARALAEDPEQAKRSQHHRGFRQPEAIESLRKDNFKSFRLGLEREGIADPVIYLQPLNEEGALQAAINWYRASDIALSTIPPVTMPTLYVWGTKDASVGRRAAELTREFVHGPYEFVEIKGGGHFIVDQMPDRVAQLLLAHLQQAK